MPSIDRKSVHLRDAPVDHLVLSLRSYVTKAKKSGKTKGKKQSRGTGRDFSIDRLAPTDWVLVFDCETTTTPDQKLKFGTYQLRHAGRLAERGLFYEPDALTPEELNVLQIAQAAELPSEAGEKICLLSRHAFVENVFFDKAYRLGAQIVGFNLPFDISRVAIRHVDARGKMRGGFSFILSEDENRPHVVVKHITQRMSFFRFTGFKPKKRRWQEDDEEKDDQPRDWDRGYFVDVKTLAAALTSASHSLESLSDSLDVPHKKLDTDRHGKPIDSRYVRYALRDTQTTWECFDSLAKQFAALKVAETGLYDLYSEASLGKAYLKTMGIKPWRDVQPKFAAKTIGTILSTYYGGRSEVHIRRQITPVIHFDFLSMYPTVCTLVNLWPFVTATGIEAIDDTTGVKHFVADCTAEALRAKAAWQNLNAIVRVLPQGDLFPVRAHYAGDEQATIGLNYLTSDEPLWFTLADVLVSKILTGKTPDILEAIRFTPISKQENLKPVSVAGKIIHPSEQDFYKELIIHRLTITKRSELADEREKPRLESERLAIKILANATSYGIFVELNVEDYVRAQPMTCYGVRERSAQIKSKKFEDPGRYFHPLLGTLITGAARLMLSLAERQVVDQGLDWAFCDTDSIAVANRGNLDPTEFKKSALAVQGWFSALNPYGESKPILQLESVNFPSGANGDLDRLEPPNCFAVSAKRYVLFNRDRDAAPIVRKASGHGLGHLWPPYDEPAKERRERVKRIGVPLWQEDLWREIIRAADSPEPDRVRYDSLRNFDLPAASRYAATTPGYLKWFDGYNGLKGNQKPYPAQVKPFNFLLSLQTKSKLEMASSDMNVLRHPLWHRRVPHPIAPYSDGEARVFENAFDRDTPDRTQIPASWLKSYARSLTRYHMHSEAKFLGGGFEGRCVLRRRHVYALAFQPIGKEADNIDEPELVDESGENIIARPFAQLDQAKLQTYVAETQRQFKISDRELCKSAKVSHHAIQAIKRRKHVDHSTLRKIAKVLETLRQKASVKLVDQDAARELLMEMREEFCTDDALAEHLGVSRRYASRLLSGERPVTQRVMSRLMK